MDNNSSGLCALPAIPIQHPTVSNGLILVVSVWKSAKKVQKSPGTVSCIAGQTRAERYVIWTLASNLLELFVYRLKRPGRPKDSTDTNHRIVEVMLRDPATLPRAYLLGDAPRRS